QRRRRQGPEAAGPAARATAHYRAPRPSGPQKKENSDRARQVSLAYAASRLDVPRATRGDLPQRGYRSAAAGGRGRVGAFHEISAAFERFHRGDFATGLGERDQAATACRIANRPPDVKPHGRDSSARKSTASRRDRPASERNRARLPFAGYGSLRRV